TGDTRPFPIAAFDVMGTLFTLESRPTIRVPRYSCNDSDSPCHPSKSLARGARPRICRRQRLDGRCEVAGRRRTGLRQSPSEATVCLRSLHLFADHEHARCGPLSHHRLARTWVRVHRTARVRATAVQGTVSLDL